MIASASYVIVVMPSVLQTVISASLLFVLLWTERQRRHLRKAVEEMNRMLSVIAMERAMHDDG